MRLTLYYLTHAVKNQIKKLFRTWVAVFLLVCLVFGLLCGLGAAALSSLFEEDVPEEEMTETLPEEEIVLSKELQDGLVELVVGGIALAVLAFSVALADKNGGSIFLMGDVNLLFPAPLKPQSVLLFRLIMQAGTSIIATIYLLFQIPNLVMNLGLGAGAAFAMLGAWFFLMLYSKLLSVLIYTVFTTRPGAKRYLRPALWGVLLLIGIFYYLYARTQPDYLAGALGFFNGPYTRYIPIWGWLKGLVLFAMEGHVVGALLSLLALLVFAVLLIAVIWRIKADFYEDAMARSEETAEKQAQAQNARPQLQKRAKNRTDKLTRDGLTRGAGASVYFFKAMYNRFRFAHLHVFTKTSETYLAVSLGICALQIFVMKTAFFPAVALALGGFAFFRSLGNPIAQDIEQDVFFLVPDSAHKKVFFSFLAGALNTALDLLPAFLVAALLLRANPLSVLLYLLLVLSVSTYSDAAGLFIDLSLSTGLSQMLRSLVQILCIYFGLIPSVVLIVLGFALGQPVLFTLLCILFHLTVTAISLGISPFIVEGGRK